MTGLIVMPSQYVLVFVLAFIIVMLRFVMLNVIMLSFMMLKEESLWITYYGESRISAIWSGVVVPNVAAPNF